jgi:iron complex transport system ATP-binding protein
VANLDPRQQHRVLGLLRELAHHDRAIVVVLHDLTLAATYADRVVVMRDGRVLADGAPSEVLTAAALGTAFDAEFTVLRSDEGHPIIAPRPARRDDAVADVPWRTAATTGTHA